MCIQNEAKKLKFYLRRYVLRKRLPLFLYKGLLVTNCSILLDIIIFNNGQFRNKISSYFILGTF